MSERVAAAKTFTILDLNKHITEIKDSIENMLAVADINDLARGGILEAVLGKFVDHFLYLFFA